MAHDRSLQPSVETNTENVPDGQGAADSRGSRTCVCANTSEHRVAHAGGEGWMKILPCNRLVGVAIPPVSRERGRAGLPKKGKWPPRGTGTTVLTYPCPSQPCFGGSKGCSRVTGRAGENGQHSGEMGGSSPWTTPSAPECGDTLKALAGDQRPI